LKELRKYAMSENMIRNRKKRQRKMLAFVSGSVSRTISPINNFLNRDGDTAIQRRIKDFLI